MVLTEEFLNVSSAFSAHHAISTQLCILFWLKLQRKGAFSKTLHALHKSHSNWPWNSSGQRPESWSGEAWESVFLLLQTELSAFWKNLALSSRKLIWRRGCQIGKHYLFHVLVKCRSCLQRKENFFLPFFCMMVLRSRRKILLLSWQHLLMYRVFSPFSLYCGNL